jgi:5-formyltetrahydrofolate cyclo-ligase
MTVDEQKKQIRKEIKILKSRLSVEEKQIRSRQILEKLAQNEAFIQAKTVMLYWAMDDEVQTQEFICNWTAKKKILLPCVTGNVMILKQFISIEQMQPGESFGIPEPTGEEFTDYSSIDVIVVPGVAFDRQNNRMGRGKAFYDKFLRNITAKKIGVCFGFQLFGNVPTDPFDVKMDLVIAE